MYKEILKNIKPRKYQEEIYNSCKDKNCLVILPTGIGKTLIALMLSINRQKEHPDNFKKNLPELFAELTLFTGKVDAEKRKKLWQNSDIIFSTPQCISDDIKNNLYHLSDVSLLIEDEAHRCLKNYSYTYIAEKYKEQSTNQRILGLTASPGTDRKTIENIAKTLGIETIEIRTRESEDVREYLQELKVEIIKINFPEEIKEIAEIIRAIYQKKIQEIKNRKLLFEPPTKTNLLKIQANLMDSIRRGNRNFNVLAGVSVLAQAIKLSYLIELLETQTLFSSDRYIKSIFEQAKTNKSKASQNIIKNPEFNKAYIKIKELLAKNIEHPKLKILKNIIEESIKENKKNKTIIFCQYRDSIIRISEELEKIEGIKLKIFVGQSKKQGTGLSQKEQQQIMSEFKEGKVNLIIATSIAEEGLDIPEVNSVIFYEPIPSAIRKIQRMGRTARLMKGKTYILLTLGTLDEIFYYASRSKEKRMYKTIDLIKKDMENKKQEKGGGNPQKKLF